MCVVFSFSVWAEFFVVAVVATRRRRTDLLPDHRPGLSRALCLSYISVGLTRALA